MHPNAELIRTLYTSFQKLDATEMKKCYHRDVQFSDPAFSSLKGKEVSAMWAMLTGNLKQGNQPWRLEFKDIQADDTQGSAHWEAYYTLSSTGKRVHNIINAKFRFQDGLIVTHTDTFHFYRWARQGFGWMGTLLGWMPFFRKKVQGRVKKLLDNYRVKHPE